MQIIPRVMPALVPEANLREKFDNEDYVKGVEDMFREKFLANLDVSFLLCFSGSGSIYIFSIIDCFKSVMVVGAIKFIEQVSKPLGASFL